MDVQSAWRPPIDLETRRVTTTDLCKLIGLVCVLVDHYGLFFDEDQLWWRVFGRVAAPIFFFLIGYARTRAVPWTWLVFGAVLTGLDYVTSGSFNDVSLNILLNFALLRGVVLPLVEARVMPHPERLAALTAACILVIAPTDSSIEYGTEGWLWAFFGLAHRLATTEDRGFKAVRTRDAMGVVTGGAYMLREIHDYGFDAAQSAILAGLVILLVIGLARFRRTSLAWAPPRPMAALLQICGRFSLEIYAISLFVMQVLAYAFDVDGGAENGDGGGEAA